MVTSIFTFLLFSRCLSAVFVYENIFCLLYFIIFFVAYTNSILVEVKSNGKSNKSDIDEKCIFRSMTAYNQPVLRMLVFLKRRRTAL